MLNRSRKVISIIVKNASRNNFEGSIAADGSQSSQVWGPRSRHIWRTHCKVFFVRTLLFDGVSLLPRHPRSTNEVLFNSPFVERLCFHPGRSYLQELQCPWSIFRRLAFKFVQDFTRGFWTRQSNPWSEVFVYEKIMSLPPRLKSLSKPFSKTCRVLFFPTSSSYASHTYVYDKMGCLWHLLIMYVFISITMCWFQSICISSRQNKSKKFNF